MNSNYTQEEVDAWWAAIHKAAAKAPTMRDNEGRRCTHCKNGVYRERSIHDDIDGTRTCTYCYHSVPHQEIVR